MMDEREHERIKSLLAPYVLGAVPDDERSEVRRHLLICEDCMLEADRLSDVEGSLAYSVEPVALPDGFADRVMAQIETDRPDAAHAARRTWWSRASGLAVAAMLLVTGVMGASLYQSNQRLNERTEAARRLLPGGGMKLQGPGALAAMVPSNGGALFVAEGLAPIWMAIGSIRCG